jgi:hypothetical protein
MDNTQGLETRDSNNIAKGNESIPYNPNRHERRALEAQYRKRFGKQASEAMRAEYKKAVAEANGEAKK